MVKKTKVKKMLRIKLTTQEVIDALADYLVAEGKIDDWAENGTMLYEVEKDAGLRVTVSYDEKSKVTTH
ncbi:MAG: hypothetical protein CBC05_01650 [Crocinitomicaceae bacterium TMED45]|jgi:mannitol/fructose-specific phosphotransferase system IIA component (Ntr-type)|nr:MAG: hypothetical protein CBC05_01650 [Crocinitomicaceae bacterium TMED45]|tara:strand:- start:13832 stop:14038 length:207 start_codon:yes stop_codon:yes gene_type:complete